MKLAYFIITILYIVIAMRFGAMLVRTAAFARRLKGAKGSASISEPQPSLGAAKGSTETAPAVHSSSLFFSEAKRNGVFMVFV